MSIDVFSKYSHLLCAQERTSKENFQALVREGRGSFSELSTTEFCKLLYMVIELFGGICGRAHTNMAAVLSQGLYVFSLAGEMEHHP